MKKISISLALFAVLGLASCDYTPENISSGNPSYGVTPADPVIVGIGTHTEGSGKKTSTYNDIWVMNADGSNQTNVYSSSSASLFTPSWSPSGKVVWRESFTLTKGKGNSARTITLYNLKAGTVSVSNGVPTMSGVTTIAPAISGNDTFMYAAAKWSSSTSTDEIAAYGYATGFNSYTVNYKVRMVDASSGTVSDFWTPSSTETLTGYLAWNYDGSKLYVATREKNSNPLHTYITIIDRASASVSGTICNGWTNAGPVNGSHAGADQLLLIGQETSSSVVTGYIYDFATSTMTQLPTSTTYSAFSSDNAKVTRNGSNNSGTELYTINGGATTQLASAGRAWDWKR